MQRGWRRVRGGGWEELVAAEGVWPPAGTADHPPQRRTGKTFVGLRREVVCRCNAGGEEERWTVNE